MKRLTLLIAFSLFSLFVFGGCDVFEGEAGVGVVDAFIEDDILKLELSDGSVVAAGDIHKDIELALAEEGLSWRYEDEEEWRLITPLEDITGADGREVELMVEENILHWRYEDDGDWMVLFDLDDLRPADLRRIEFRSLEDEAEWRFLGEDAWRHLVSVEELACEECVIEDVRFNEDGLVEVALDDGSVETLRSPRDAYIVQFVDAEGRLVDVARVFHGDSVTPPEAPTKEGHTFTDWSESLDRITRDKRIEALYAIEEYTVRYETYMEEGLPDETLAYGEDLSLPVLEMEDHLFVGWYADSEFRHFFNETTMPAEDITLHARWVDLTGEGYEAVETVEEMLERVRDGVVGVVSEWMENGQPETASGSGSVYRHNDGRYYVVTNHHVIEDHETLAIYYEKHGNPYFIEDADIELLGSYAAADIAVLRFEAPHDFEVLDFADSYELRIGNRIYAIGHPQGFDHYGSVTTGIISNLTRYMDFEDIEAPFIQHDAAINPGNSGGPLIDAQGRIVGMNTLKMAGTLIEGMGYALPANTMVRMIEDLEEQGYVQRGRLGVGVSHPSECGAEYGACIDEIVPGSTADNMNLETGDLIIGYKTATMSDFLTVKNLPALLEFVLNTRVGEEVVILYERDGIVAETSPTPLMPGQ